MSFWKVALLLAFVGSVKAAPSATNLAKENGLVFNGTCPKIYKDFSTYDSSLTFGSWYIYYGDINLFEEGKKCAFYNFTLENGTVQVKKYETDLSNNAIVMSRATMEPNAAEGTSTLHWYTPIKYSRTLRCFAGDWINYFLCYSCMECSNFGEDIGIHLYLFTKVRNPLCTVLEAANNDLQNYNLTLSDIPTYDQEDCPFG